jgi:hypothetical protein
MDDNTSDEEPVGYSVPPTDPVAADPPECPVTPVGYQPPQGREFSPGVYRRLASGLYQRDEAASASTSNAQSSTAVTLVW